MYWSAGRAGGNNLTFFRSKIIGLRLFRILIFAIGGVVAIAALVWHVSIEPALRMGVAKSQNEVARRATDQIQEFVRHRIDELVAVAEVGSFWKMSTVAQKGSLYRLMKVDPKIQEVSVVDRTGQEVLRLSRSRVYADADLTSLEREKKFRQAIQGKIYIGEVYHARTAEPFITVAVPLKFTATDIRGVLVGEIGLKTLWDSISHIKVGKAGSGFVVDRVGKLIAHPDYSKVLLGMNVAQVHRVKEFLSHTDLDVDVAEPVIGQDGKKVMSSFAQVEGLNWAVFVEEPVETALAEVRRIQELAILLFVLMAAGALAVSYSFSQRIARPIRELEKGARLIAQSKLEHKLAIHTGDEIEVLSDQFNRMAQALKESYQGLEEKIADRTKEISTLYSALAPLAPADSTSDMLKRVIERLMRATGADAGLVRIMDKTTGAFVYPAQIGFPSNYLEATQRLQEGSAVALAFRTAQPVIAANIAEDPRIKGKKQLQAGFQSCAFLPLKVTNDVRGVIHLASRELGHFKQSKKDHLMAIAHQMGVAMENRELFEQATKDSQEQQVLREFLSQLLLLDLDELLQKITEQAAVLFKAEYVWLRLFDEHGQVKTRAVAGDKEVIELMSITGEREELLGRGRQMSDSRKPLAIKDMALDAGGRPSRGVKAGLHGFLGAPLLGKDQRPLGIIHLMTRSSRDFTQHDLDLIQQFSNMAVIALENAKLFKEMRQNLERVRALREIDQAITSTLELDAVLKVLLEKIDLVLPYSATTVRLFNRGSGLLEPVACRNLDEKEWKAERWRGGRGTPNVAFESKAPVMVSNVQTDARVKDPEFFRKHGLVSYLGMPLIVKDEVLGVISFYTKEEHEFSKEEVEFLTTLAGQAAIAIGNARLHDETERRRREAEELARVAQSLTQTLDMTAVAEGIVTSVRGLLGVKASTLRLLQPDGSLRTLASSGEGFSFSSEGNVLPPGVGLASVAVAERRPIWSADVLNEPEIRLTDQMRDYQLRSGNHSMIAVPLCAQEKIVGSLGLADRKGRIYPDSEVKLVQTFADQAALALENARLYEEVRRNLQELQQKAAELERASRAKSEFLSVMSHELVTPLHAVMAFTGMIQGGIFGPINQEQDEVLGKVLTHSKDLFTTIREVLEATRIEAEAVQVGSEEFRVGDFLGELRSLYDVPLDKELSLKWDYPCEGVFLRTDRDKLRHIHRNLINNAIKFTERGSVTISARHIPKAKAVEFKVVDTGIGISEQALPTVFKMFRQVDSSETRSYGGTGVGLYVVKRYTELLGGKIDVESEPGKGSTFTVTIPEIQK